MANYSLIANTQYKARNFEDLLRPYTMYTQEYRNQENAIADLATKADVWQGMANEQTDPVAYAQITNYANALKEQAAVIADRGLNSSSRQAMLNLKRRYSSEITPVEQAFATRKAQADEQRKALLANPTLMLSRRADATSLDDYMGNPNLGYESYSGALLTQQVGQAASNLAKELRDYGNGKRLDAYTKTWLQQHGYTAAEVAFAINNPNDPRASNVLNTIVSNVMADSGMSQWADNRTLNQAYSYARQGLWNAVGQTTVQPYADEGAKLAAQAAMSRRAQSGSAGTATPPSPNLKLYGTRRVATPHEMDQKVKDYDSIKKYFYKKNGEWRMTVEGQRLYANQKKEIEDAVKYNTNSHNPYSHQVHNISLYTTINRLGLQRMAERRYRPEQYKILDDLKAFYDNKGYDTTLATEYTLSIDPADFKKVSAVISASADAKNQVNNYEYAKKDDGSYYLEKNGNKVDISDLDPAKIASAILVYGNHGNYYEVKYGDTTLKVPVETTIQKNKNLTKGYQDRVNELNTLYNKGTKYIVNKDGSVDNVETLINNDLGKWGETLLNGLGLISTKNQIYEPHISLE